MYSIIGFNILPKEIEFPEELKRTVYLQSDVIRHDSYATFTINGEEKRLLHGYLFNQAL